MLTLAMVVMMNPVMTDEPKKDEKFPLRVTLRFTDLQKKDIIREGLQGRLVKSKKNTDILDIKNNGTLAADKPQVGGTITEEDGPNKGTVWVIDKVSYPGTGVITFVVTKK